MQRMMPLAFALALSLTAMARGADAPQSDLDQLQGTWTVVSWERGGKALAPERLKGRAVVIEGKTWRDRTGEKVYGQGVLTLDPSASPKTIDAMFTEGFPKGKTTLGIYELEGDTLKACQAEPGDDRPTAFLAKPGTTLLLVVLKRRKP